MIVSLHILLGEVGFAKFHAEVAMSRGAMMMGLCLSDEGIRNHRPPNLGFRRIGMRPHRYEESGCLDLAKRAKLA